MSSQYLARLSATDLAARITTPEFVSGLVESAVAQKRKRPSRGEQDTWRNSYSRLAGDLIEAGLGGIEVFVEYEIDDHDVRPDAVLAGRHPDTGDPSYVVVELKQWAKADPVPGRPHRCVLPGASRDKPNPIHQVRGFCAGLLEVHGAIAGHPDRIVGAVYLHDAKRASVADLTKPLAADSNATLYTMDDRGLFVRMLRTRLSPVPDRSAGDLFANAAIGGAQPLHARVKGVLRGQEQFHLIGDQVAAYGAVRAGVRRAVEDDVKTVVIITGEPGTGKTAIALQLLRDLSAAGHRVVSTNGSRAFMSVIRKAAGGGKSGHRHLFKYNNAFMAAERNGLDVLICDEAHGVRAKSTDRRLRSAVTKGRSQIQELIDAARVSVFLLDEYQGVRPVEIGTFDAIVELAHERGAHVEDFQLQEQFRCGGSRAYVDWVHRLLGLVPNTAPKPWRPDGLMELRLARNPDAMTAYLAHRQSIPGRSARITAGFCWPWSAPEDQGRLVADVCIGEWSRPWNSKADAVRNGAPPGAGWAVQAGGFDQVGCVYTARGLEYDWGGVLMGGDLIRRRGRWQAVRAENHDPDLRTATDAEFDRCVRNVYKILLTRSRTGTVVYSVDPETQAFLSTVITKGIDAP